MQSKTAKQPLLHSTKSHKGNWECGIPWWNLRRISVLHSTKSHKGNWEMTVVVKKSGVVISSCIQRNPTKGIESSSNTLMSGSSLISISCIQRNPTKGIESEHMVELKEMLKPKQLHSTKSHKGNWEYNSSAYPWYGSGPSCIQRNPTKGIESQAKVAQAWRHRSLCCIQRNPTKGIER